jgi:hypothetical protein
LTAGVDGAVLEYLGGGMLRLRSANGSFEVTEFTAPSGSLTINAGDEADTITADELGGSFSGNLIVNGDAGVDAYVLNGGTIHGLNAAAGTAVLNGETLSGNGTVNGAMTISAGADGESSIAPGSGSGSTGTGTLQTGDLMLEASLGGQKASFHVDIAVEGAIVAGQDYDQLAVTGSVDIATDASRLNVTVDATNGLPTIGDQFVIIDNDLSDPVTGKFANFDGVSHVVLDEGDLFIVGGVTFQISYEGAMEMTSSYRLFRLRCQTLAI